MNYTSDFVLSFKCGPPVFFFWSLETEELHWTDQTVVFFWHDGETEQKNPIVFVDILPGTKSRLRFASMIDFWLGVLSKRWKGAISELLVEVCFKPLIHPRRTWSQKKIQLGHIFSWDIYVSTFCQRLNHQREDTLPETNISPWKIGQNTHRKELGIVPFAFATIFPGDFFTSKTSCPLDLSFPITFARQNATRWASSYIMGGEITL